MVLGMRDRQEYPRDAAIRRAAGRFAAERDDRTTQVVGEDFHVRPGDFAPPTRADHLENRLLGSPTAGDERHGVLELLRAFLLRGSQHAIEESLAMVVEDAGDARTFDKIESVAEDGHEVTLTRAMAHVE